MNTKRRYSLKLVGLIAHVSLAGSLFVLSGCRDSLGISSAGEHFERGATQMANAVAQFGGNIDPLALKATLQKNESLEQKVRELEEAARIAQAQKGAVNLRAGSLWLHCRVSDLNEEETAFAIQYFLDDQLLPLLRADPVVLKRGQIFDREIRLSDSLGLPGKHSVSASFRQTVGGFVVRTTLFQRSSENEPGAPVANFDFSSSDTLSTAIENTPNSLNFKRLTNPILSFNVIWDTTVK